MAEASVRLSVSEFLELAESAGRLVVWDTEATGLSGDHHSVLVVSVKPVGRRARSWMVRRPGDDREVVAEAGAALEAAAGWISYYGRGFDLPMLQTRRLRWGLPPIAIRPHLDLYWVLRTGLVMSRRSQAHYLAFLGLPPVARGKAEAKMAQKMTLSPEVWNAVLAQPRRYLPRLRRRCESDCQGLEDLYRAVRPWVRRMAR